MGIVLDSSVLITAERRGLNLRETLSELTDRFPNEEMAVSVITLAELSQGIARANSQRIRVKREQFVSELTHTLQVFPVSSAITKRAGLLSGEAAAAGLQVALPDLLIGVTALQLSYRAATHNYRHFRMIPGLEIEPL